MILQNNPEALVVPALIHEYDNLLVCECAAEGKCRADLLASNSFDNEVVVFFWYKIHLQQHLF